MKYLWISCLIVAAVAVAAGGVAYYGMRAPECRQGACCGGQDDELAWLRQEFKLNEQQMQQIKACYEAYRVACVQHCATFDESSRLLEEARAEKRSPAEISAAEARLEAIDGECKASTAAHVREVAAIMGGEAGQRYLSIVLPLVESFDHCAVATSTDASATTQPSLPHEHPAGH